MNTKQQYIQQAKQLARDEARNTFNSVKEQIGGSAAGAQNAVDSAQPVTENGGANIEEIKRQEAVKLAQLRQRLDDEIQRVRQMRQQSYQEYVQKVDEQMKADQPKEGEQAPVEIPHSVQKGPRGPAGPQSKKGTRETGKIKG